MPAYKAARTLEKTYREIPPGSFDQVLVVDDASPDDTVDVARALGLPVRRHESNRGYGGNQKTCYDWALAEGADIGWVGWDDGTPLDAAARSEAEDVVAWLRSLGAPSARR